MWTATWCVTLAACQVVVGSPYIGREPQVVQWMDDNNLLSGINDVVEKNYYLKKGDVGLATPEELPAPSPTPRPPTEDNVDYPTTENPLKTNEMLKSFRAHSPDEENLVDDLMEAIKTSGTPSEVKENLKSLMEKIENSENTVEDTLMSTRDTNPQEPLDPHSFNVQSPNKNGVFLVLKGVNDKSTQTRNVITIRAQPEESQPLSTFNNQESPLPAVLSKALLQMFGQEPLRQPTAVESQNSLHPIFRIRLRKTVSRKLISRPTETEETLPCGANESGDEASPQSIPKDSGHPLFRIIFRSSSIMPLDKTSQNNRISVQDLIREPNPLKSFFDREIGSHSVRRSDDFPKPTVRMIVRLSSPSLPSAPERLDDVRTCGSDDDSSQEDSKSQNHVRRINQTPSETSPAVDSLLLKSLLPRAFFVWKDMDELTKTRSARHERVVFPQQTGSINPFGTSSRYVAIPTKGTFQPNQDPPMKFPDDLKYRKIDLPRMKEDEADDEFPEILRSLARKQQSRQEDFGAVNDVVKKLFQLAEDSSSGPQTFGPEENDSTDQGRRQGADVVKKFFQLAEDSSSGPQTLGPEENDSADQGRRQGAIRFITAAEK